MIVSIHQPQYLPWLGYFEKIDRADVFVLLDTVQYKKNEWQNRNRIKSDKGWQWLTVPVTYRFPELIKDVAINNTDLWQHRQRQAIISCYRRAPYWKVLEDFLEKLFSNEWRYIAPLNIFVIKELCKILGIDTPLYVASELGEFPDDPDERIMAITKYFNAATYLSGGGGKEYMDLEKYKSNNIELLFQDYNHPVYNQLFGNFEPYMSVIDLIFNHGDKSCSILRNLK